MCDCKPGVPACMSCLRETFPVSRNDMLLCDRTVNMRMSFKTKHAFTYVNEYERFKGSLLTLDANRCQWIELDNIYHELKIDIHDNPEIYIELCGPARENFIPAEE